MVATKLNEMSSAELADYYKRHRDLAEECVNQQYDEIAELRAQLAEKDKVIGRLLGTMTNAHALMLDGKGGEAEVLIWCALNSKTVKLEDCGPSDCPEITALLNAAPNTDGAQ